MKHEQFYMVLCSVLFLSFSILDRSLVTYMQFVTVLCDFPSYLLPSNPHEHTDEILQESVLDSFLRFCLDAVQSGRGNSSNHRNSPKLKCRRTVTETKILLFLPYIL